MKRIPRLSLCLPVLLFFQLSQLLSQLGNPELLIEGETSIACMVNIDLNGDEYADFIGVRLGAKVNDTLVGGVYTYTGLGPDSIIEYSTEKFSDGIFGEVMTIDWDHDGDEDLLLKKWPYGQINYYVRAMNESGTFEIDQELPLFLKDSSVIVTEVVDVNKDGLDDLIYRYSSFTNDTIYFAVAKPGGTFESIAINAFDGEFLFDFFNGDTIIDFLVENKDLDYLIALLSDGSFSYQSFVVDSAYTFHKNLRGVADLTNDGTLEILVSDNVPDTIYMIDKIELGGESITRPLFLQDFGGIYILDFNHDGALDIYVNNGIAEGLHRNDGTGNFIQTFVEINDFPIGELIYSDIDTMNHKATHYYFDTRNYRFRIDGDKFRTEVPAFPELIIDSIDDIDMHDINNDGIKDLFFTTRWGGAVSYLKGAKGKKFGEVVPIAMDEEGALDLALDDFNADGNMDIAYSSIWGGNLAVKYGDGAGGFSNRLFLKEDWGLVRGSTSGDFEDDGYPDIVLSNISTNEMIIYRNHLGEFQSPTHLSTGQSFDPLTTRDIDFDGDPDLLGHVYGANGQFILIYENDGSGQLVYDDKYLTSNSFNEYFLDFDGDGKDEFVGAYQSQVTVWKFDGSFYAPWLTVPIEDMNAPYPFVVLDYDGDGYLDIIVEELSPLEHRLYKNYKNEEIIFDDIASEKLQIRLPEFRDVDEYVVDLDGDGDYDLLYNEWGNMYRISDLKGDRSISGITFSDLDQDSIFSETDQGIQDFRIDLTSGNGEQVSTFSNQKGEFEIFADTGWHQIQAVALNDCWKATFEEPKDVYLPASGLQNVNFPFVSQGEGSSIIASISRAPTRCGFTVRYFFTLTNTGCNTIFGNAIFDLDPRVSNFFEISLDEFTLDGNQIQFPLDVLLPGESIRFNMLVEVPGVEFINEILEDQINMFYDFEDGSTLDKTFTKGFNSEIRCAYDPNDKIMSPDRSNQYDKAYVIDESILYTIRFQNTGNDTAFNIRLTDTLSNLLDLSTFRPVDASHPYRLEINTEDRSLEVFFENILLPDSTINQIGSNGFFTFSIELSKGLNDFTPITNSAAIYFDFNPPIYTNDMLIEYVSDLSLVTTSVKPDIVNGPLLYPNPTDGSFSILTTDEVFEVQVFDLTGHKRSVIVNDNVVNANALESGVFTILMRTNTGLYYQRIVIVDK